MLAQLEMARLISQIDFWRKISIWKNKTENAQRSNSSNHFDVGLNEYVHHFDSIWTADAYIIFNAKIWKERTKNFKFEEANFRVKLVNRKAS